jgi:hypothetical protein
MTPERAALADLFRARGFWLTHAAAFALWTALALSWFWMPDSSAGWLALSAAQALLVAAALVWLLRRTMRFYGAGALRRALGSPRFYLDIAVLAALGAWIPYKLLTWRPAVTGLPAQTASLTIRFGMAFLLAVTAILAFSALTARMGKYRTEGPARPTPTPSSPHAAPPAR